MSLPPKETDLVGILNDYEVKIQELEFLVSSQDFDTGSGLIGPQGPQGLTGSTGPQGPAATVSVGAITTGSAGSSATVTNAGTSSAAVFNFTIPRGDTGATGPQGPAGINAGGPNPVGGIIKYGSASAPSGWLLCDGSAVSRTTYANLFAVIGTNYGSGDGSTTFNVPTVADSIIAYQDSGTSGGTSSATGARVMFFS